MSVLQVADVSFGYGAERLFRSVTFCLNAGQRAALVAPNGAGKTTLLRIIAGELAPDNGSVIIAKDTSVGYYRQSHEMVVTGTLMDAMLANFQDVLQIRRNLQCARAAAASGKPEDLAHLAHEEERYHLARGDELERRVMTIAQRLGFCQQQLCRPVASLSGGERGRLYLGAILARQPQLLLIDEPTNHLDLQTIDWLEAYLKQYIGTMLIVSHDRAFLDNLCPITLELGHRCFRTYNVAYSAYVQARELDLKREQALLDRQQAMIFKTEQFIRKNIAGQKTKQAQSRRKMLEKLDRLEAPEDVWQPAQQLHFRFCQAPRSGDIVLEATGLGAIRGGRKLFEGVDVLVRRGERVAIVGPNGCGKTTLLSLLAGRADEPSEVVQSVDPITGPKPSELNDLCVNMGKVRQGASVLDGYFDQHLGSLKLQNRAIDEIQSVRGDMNVDTIRTYLARFRFWGDQPFGTVASMSGGERSRLALAKLLLEPRNLLFFDEPTNHLDIPAAEILEQALIHFDGTVVFVSHDRTFLRNVSTRVIAFEADGISMIPTGFDHPLNDSFNEQMRPDGGVVRQSAVPVISKARREEHLSSKQQFEANKAFTRQWQKKQRRFAQLEEMIERVEGQINELQQKLANASMDETPQDTWEQLSIWSVEQQQLECQLQEMMTEWSDLGRQLDEAEVR